MTTINEALSLTKMIRQRISSLEQLRDKTSVKETYFGTKDRVTEPQYDVKEVDKKITILQEMLYTIDVAIKQSNAVTAIDIDIDKKVVFEPLN